LIGCSSLTSRSEAEGVAAWRQLAAHLAPDEWQTRPHMEFACRTHAEETLPAVKIPRLMAAYFTLGARICGEPAIDREFGTIDFLTWLDLHALAPRVARKFLG
jgi:putative hemolysin